LKDVYIPHGVTMNSSINEVSYCFDSASIKKTVNREYPIVVSLSFNYPEGWYRVSIYLRNTTMVVASFTSIGN
jgi:hypothetical protein